MRYSHGTLIWVKCDDGCWWPAKVRDVETEIIRLLDEPVAFCVGFYHDPNQLYPILSSDLHCIHLFHADFSSRSPEERPWFNNPTTRRAVDQALRDAGASLNASERQNTTQGIPDNIDDPLRLRGQMNEGLETPLSIDELRNIQLLISAVGGETANQLRATLARNGFEIPTRKVKRRQRQELTMRRSSRPRITTPPRRVKPTPPCEAVTAASVMSGCRLVEDDLEPQPDKTINFSAGDVAPVVARMTDHGSEVRQRGTREKSNARFVVPLSSDVLNVLRSEVFENSMRFVLSPVFRFIELLGAVEVDTEPVVCRLPSPRALRETPPDGFASNRHVLLVPLTKENYLHTSGWMVPVVVDGKNLAMILKVNGVVTPTPPNWNLAPGKEANAIKTSPVADITHLVMSQEDDLFVLEIGFTWIPDDTFLWSGIVACIFVEKIPLDTISRQIVGNYCGDASVGTAFARDGPVTCDAVRVTEVSVKVKCPLTSLPMVIPARTLTCAHMQCMELETILVRFTQSNLWNCPLCGAPSRLHEIRVNYRLKEWLDTHRNEIDRVDYIIETPLGSQLRLQWREEDVKETYFIED
ncbi:unnamed protein product [Phytomonas sp. EM1]|nr:unnamed protein product [Phytomonas sp. EM1]|eukprot:CCW61502.1 unnamed protein product [Phytomonas sp. isolate EM1]